MKICRFDLDEGARDCLGVVEGDWILDVSAAKGVLPAVQWPVPPGDLLIAHLDAVVAEIKELLLDAPAIPLADVKLRAPVANPSKIICGAGNWPEHTAAMGGKTPGEVGLLYKVTSALAGPGDEVILTLPERETVHEGELAVIIGRGGRHIPASAALSHVAGYAGALDMTMQGPEFMSHQKCFDTYGVIGPWLVTTDEVPDPGELSFRLWVNDELRQEDHFGRLVFDVPRLVEYASSVMTLSPGDIILSGTPLGVAPVVPGDIMRLEIDRLGEMRIPVRAAL